MVNRFINKKTPKRLEITWTLHTIYEWENKGVEKSVTCNGIKAEQMTIYGLDCDAISTFMNWNICVVLQQRQFRNIPVLQGKWCSRVTSLRAKRAEGTSLSTSTFHPRLVTPNSNQTTTIAQRANMWPVAEVRIRTTVKKWILWLGCNELIIKTLLPISDYFFLNLFF